MAPPLLGVNFQGWEMLHWYISGCLLEPTKNSKNKTEMNQNQPMIAGKIGSGFLSWWIGFGSKIEEPIFDLILVLATNQPNQN